MGNDSVNVNLLLVRHREYDITRVEVLGSVVHQVVFVCAKPPKSIRHWASLFFMSCIKRMKLAIWSFGHLSGERLMECLIN